MLQLAIAPFEGMFVCLNRKLQERERDSAILSSGRSSRDKTLRKGSGSSRKFPYPWHVVSPLYRPISDRAC